MSNVLIILHAKVNGTDIEIRRIMDIAKLASKKKLIKIKELKKILILISCLIVKGAANKKI